MDLPNPEKTGQGKFDHGRIGQIVGKGQGKFGQGMIGKEKNIKGKEGHGKFGSEE